MSTASLLSLWVGYDATVGGWDLAKEQLLRAEDVERRSRLCAALCPRRFVARAGEDRIVAVAGHHGNGNVVALLAV